MVVALDVYLSNFYVTGWIRMEYPHCAICLKTIESDGVVLTSKGIDGVNRASKARGDTVSVVQGDSVHKECRQNYTRPSNIAKYVRRSEEAEHARRNLRPRRKLPFDFKKDCLFCGTEIDKERERKRARVVCTVRTMDMQQTILNECEARGDEWAETVRARIQSVHDLPAADAIYHHSCSTNFRTKMNIPGSFISDQPEKKKMKTGRPVDQNLNQAFLKVVQYVEENDDEQVTISDLTEKMQGFLEESGRRNGVQHPSYERTINGAFRRERNNYKQTWKDKYRNIQKDCRVYIRRVSHEVERTREY